MIRVKMKKQMKKKNENMKKEIDEKNMKKKIDENR